MRGWEPSAGFGERRHVVRLALRLRGGLRSGRALVSEAERAVFGGMAAAAAVRGIALGEREARDSVQAYVATQALSEVLRFSPRAGPHGAP